MMDTDVYYGQLYHECAANLTRCTPLTRVELLARDANKHVSAQKVCVHKYQEFTINIRPVHVVGMGETRGFDPSWFLS